MSLRDPMEGIPPSVFRARRAAVLRALGGGVLVLPSAPVLYRSRDTEVPYRPDSELYYLTGATEPGTVAVLVGGAEPRLVLFVRDRDPEAELWSGSRLGLEASAERFGAEETYSVAELAFRLPTLLRGGDRIHARLGGHPEMDRYVVAALAEARTRGARQGNGPRAVVDPGEILDDLRLVKDSHEVERLRAAARLTVEGHRAGASAVRPGAGEWEVQAAVDAAFRRGGAPGSGFGTIVGSGSNACTLHYVDNGRVIRDRDLVLVDAGAELALYQGDVTRVYPSGGGFTGSQRAVYEVVNAARRAAVACAGPGRTISDVHQAAVRVLVDGLTALGVLTGPVDDLVGQEAHKPYFPHQTSHWLGLDVHDPGDYSRGGESRVLEPGMVFTVEPGLYFPPGLEGPGAAYAGIGIRLEDDVLVTAEGRENLTGELPVDPDEVEALVRGGT